MELRELHAALTGPCRRRHVCVKVFRSGCRGVGLRFVHHDTKIRRRSRSMPCSIISPQQPQGQSRCLYTGNKAEKIREGVSSVSSGGSHNRLKVPFFQALVPPVRSGALRLLLLFVILPRVYLVPGVSCIYIIGTAYISACTSWHQVPHLGALLSTHPTPLSLLK